MSTLVDTADDDLIITVAQFIAELDEDQSTHTELADTPTKKFVAQCESLMEQLQWSALLNLLLSNPESLFSKAGEKDVEACFTVISNMVSKLPEEECLAAATQICATTASSSSENAALKLRILFGLFNIVAFSSVKYAILLRILSLCAATNQADQLTPATKRVEGWVKDWGLSVDEARSLYLEFSDAMKGIKGANRETFNFLVKYLATYEDVEGAIPTQVAEQAVRAAVEFIASPDLFQSDLLDNKSITEMHNDKKYGNVFQLLSLFLTGTLEDYLKWHSANPQVVASLDLSHEDCVNKMRLMSLASLGAETVSGEIPYSQVKKTLQVEDDEVESWIVKGIGMKLIEAKMDQLREIVVISRCTHRVFGQAQWVDLRSRLANWQGVLKGCLAAAPDLVNKQKERQLETAKFV